MSSPSFPSPSLRDDEEEEFVFYLEDDARTFTFLEDDEDAQYRQNALNQFVAPYSGPLDEEFPEGHDASFEEHTTNNGQPGDHPAWQDWPTFLEVEAGSPPDNSQELSSPVLGVPDSTTVVIVISDDEEEEELPARKRQREESIVWLSQMPPAKIRR